MTKQKVNLSAIALDVDKDVEGIWHEFVPGLEVRIARLGNPNYKQHVAKLMKPFARMGKGGLSNDERLERVTKPAVAKHIIKDWRGMVEGEEGNEVDVVYSAKKALEIILDPKFAPFYEWVIQTSSDNEEYTQAFEDELAGN